MGWNCCRRILFQILLVVTFATPVSLASAQGSGLWTVQSVKAGTEISCDAFASGAIGRQPYEFRFRRSANRLLLIVSYDGPKIREPSDSATIILTKAGTQTVLQQVRLPAQHLKFGARNAVVVSINPASMDFKIFNQNAVLRTVAGADIFEIAFLAADRVGGKMEACLKTIGQ